MFIYILLISKAGEDDRMELSGNIFFQLGLIVTVAAVAAFLLRLLKQPQILAYVITGILLTPVFGLITNTATIEAMSIIGIAFLLFLVGLEMDLKSLKSVALVSTIGGSIQIVFLFVLGYLVALLLGYLSLEAAYIGLLLAFSSTMVVMKILSDKRELQTLHGRIVVGILLLEDIIAIFALSILTSVNGFTPAILGIALLKFLALFSVAYLSSRYLFPHIFRVAAKHQELLLLLALAVCFVFSLAFQYLGFSIAIGAFLAGIALGNLPYNLDIIAKVRSLRDFFSLLFFVSLGMGLSMKAISGVWLPVVVLLGLVFLIKPLVTMTICSLFKYTKKPSFQAANALTQVGEFSLIIGAQGLFLGHISQGLFSIIVVVTLVTITVSSYFMKYDQGLYRFLEKPLRIFDHFTTQGMEYLPSKKAFVSIILCGHNRIGYSILKNLEAVKKQVLVVDYNPTVIQDMIDQGYHCLYGDVTDDEILERMSLSRAKLVISTIPDLQDSLYLLKKVRDVNRKAEIIVTAADTDSALKLYEHGADYVIMPHFLGGEHVARMITKLRANKLKLPHERHRHLKHIKERRF